MLQKAAYKAVVNAFCRGMFFEKTDVYFTSISEEELQSYLNQAHYLDKAGAYAIQSEAAKFISRIDGCYYNVMGLPVSKLYAALKQLNFQG